MAWIHTCFRPLTGLSISLLIKSDQRDEEPQGFRPLTGLSISLRRQQIRKNAGVLVSVPLRGYLFHYAGNCESELEVYMFPSPYEVIYFITDMEHTDGQPVKSFRPLTGLSISLRTQ